MATFEKNGETYTVTKRGLFYVEGYRPAERENGTAREYERVPRNFIGRFYDWLEEVELDHTGLFWGTATVVLLAFLAYLGWVVFMLEPWIYGIDIWTAVIIVTTAVCVVVTCLCVQEWIVSAITPWINERKMAAKTK